MQFLKTNTRKELIVFVIARNILVILLRCPSFDNSEARRVGDILCSEQLLRIHSEIIILVRAVRVFKVKHFLVYIINSARNQGESENIAAHLWNVCAPGIDFAKSNTLGFTDSLVPAREPSFYQNVRNQNIQVLAKNEDQNGYGRPTKVRCGGDLVGIHVSKWFETIIFLGRNKRESEGFSDREVHVAKFILVVLTSHRNFSIFMPSVV